jgi:HlyD family secretion protein
MGPPGTGHPLHTIAVIGALVGAVAILVFLILGSRVAPPRAPGVVHTTEIKIAPEISGRLSRFGVTQGQRVREGNELVELVNPELSASLVLAKAERARDRNGQRGSGLCRAAIRAQIQTRCRWVRLAPGPR